MHVESGQLALREAGLYEEFCRHVHPQGEALRVLDKAGTVFIDHPPAEGMGGRPEIQRTALRDMLVASLYPGRIVRGRKFAAVRPLDGGRHELTFADGNRTSVDSLIGADGTWSKALAASDTKPEYCGISYLDITSRTPRRASRILAAIVGTGMLFALSDNKALGGHGGRHIHLGASLRVPEDWIVSSGVDWSNAAAARAVLLEQFADWSRELKDLIAHCDDRIIPRLIYALPIGHRWPRIPGERCSAIRARDVTLCR